MAITYNRNPSHRQIIVRNKILRSHKKGRHDDQTQQESFISPNNRQQYGLGDQKENIKDGDHVEQESFISANNSQESDLRSHREQ